MDKFHETSRLELTTFFFELLNPGQKGRIGCLDLFSLLSLEVHFHLHLAYFCLNWKSKSQMAHQKPTSGFKQKTGGALRLTRET